MSSSEIIGEKGGVLISELVSDSLSESEVKLESENKLSSGSATQSGVNVSCADSVEP